MQVLRGRAPIGEHILAMHFHPFTKRTLALLAVGAVSFAGPVSAGEKLKVFILAGQSNMVGHANPHTIATLYQSGSDKDNRLAEMVFKKDSGLSKKVLQAQLEQARKIDELSGGISGEKIKALPDGAEKKALEEKVNALKEEHKAYQEKVTSSLVVSDRVSGH